MLPRIIPWSLPLALTLALSAGSTACVSEAVNTTARDPTDEREPGKRVHLGGPARSAETDAEVASVPVVGSSLVSVRATVVVEAAAERVREVVFDVARYPDFMPSVRSGRSLGRTAAGGRSIYLEFEEMGGAIQLWVRAEISPAVSSGTLESYDGRLVAGNIKDYTIRWRFEALERKRTRLTVDSFVDPDLFFVPSSLINRVSLVAAKNAILAIKNRAEFAAPR